MDVWADLRTQARWASKLQYDKLDDANTATIKEANLRLTRPNVKMQQG